MIAMILRVGGILGVLLLYRWMFHLSNPRHDYWLVADWSIKAGWWVRRKASAMRVWLFAQMGITQSIWKRLRRDAHKLEWQVE